MRAFTDMSAGLKGELGAVVIIERPKRSNDGKIVGALSDILEPVPHYQAGLTVAFVSRLHGG